MTRWLHLAFRAATVVMVGVSIAAVIPFLGHPSPAQGQLSGIGGFGGTCPGFGFGGFGNFGGCTFGGGFGGSFSGFGGVVGGGLTGFGGFVVATPDSTVNVGERLPLILGWIVPAPDTWRDLRSLEVRLREERRVALWLRWDERRNTLALIDPSTGEESGPRRHPGSQGQLSTRLAALEVGDSAVENSGPGGDSVALLLPITFAPAAGARTYLLEIGATHDNGESFFATVGRVTVQRK